MFSNESNFWFISTGNSRHTVFSKISIKIDILNRNLRVPRQWAPRWDGTAGRHPWCPRTGPSRARTTNAAIYRIGHFQVTDSRLSYFQVADLFSLLREKRSFRKEFFRATQRKQILGSFSTDKELSDSARPLRCWLLLSTQWAESGNILIYGFLISRLSGSKIGLWPRDFA